MHSIYILIFYIIYKDNIFLLNIHMHVCVFIHSAVNQYLKSSFPKRDKRQI